MPKSVVIIGGGIAGVSAAEEIRNRDESCDIFVIERENNPLYSRVLLPHYVKGIVPREKVFLKSDAWYAQKRIVYLSGTEATAIDTANQFVRISDDRELPYDALIIATGARPRLLTPHLKGMHYLYTLADADGVRAHLERLRPSESALVYGGGFIACEFINLLEKFGKKPKVLLRGKGFWSKSLKEEGQYVLRDILKANKIELYENAGEIEPYAEADGATLAGVKDAHGNEYPAQFLGIGMGIEFETELASDAGIAVSQGILAEKNLLTGAPHVYTAGDVAQAFDECVGRAYTHGNWAHAQQEGKKAARTLRGEEGGASSPSQYSTDLLGTKIAFLGDVEIASAHEVRVVPQSTGYTQIFLRDGNLVGAILIGNLTDRMKLVGLIGKKWE